ncbi:hypothetical protein [Vibrio inusitatus]|nr:hypothetical protein [Vibrio inusitatus]
MSAVTEFGLDKTVIAEISEYSISGYQEKGLICARTSTFTALGQLAV